MSSPAKTIQVKLSNPEKIFWPEEGYTKLDLYRYYERIFPKLKPYVADRILSLERCPDGMRGPCFYQKQKPQGIPAGTPTKRIESPSSRRGYVDYIVGGSLATQLALVNLGCIAVHVCGSRAKSFPKPDWVCFDIDPSSGRFADAVQASWWLKERLDAWGLKSYPKTSGSRGMHVFIPIRIGPTADRVLTFAEAVAKSVVAAHPRELTLEHSIAARGNRVYIDPFRNGSLQTVAAPYAVRRRARAPFSMPLEWSEVRPSLDPTTFNLGNFEEHLRRRGPLWADFFECRQDLDAAIERVKLL